MSRKPTPIDELSNDWVRHLAKKYPSYATYLGFPGGEREMDDHSPTALKPVSYTHLTLPTILRV